MGTIRPEALERRLEQGDRPFVLDIRPSAAYRAGSIEKSSNVAVYDSLRRGDESALLDRLDELPDDDEIVVVCKQGIVARRATRLLNDEGYTATTLAGGMGGWNGYKRGSIGYRLRSLLWRLTP
jgi:rhodanese-related sulfurtransferase